MIKACEYIDDSGRNQFGAWRAKLDVATRTRIDIALDRLERGNTSAMKAVGAGVTELRLDFGPGYRVYCAMDGEALVILLGAEQSSGSNPTLLPPNFYGKNINREKGVEMGTTKDFNETVRADLEKSAGYRRAYLREAVGCVVSGDVETGKSLLRKYINGTVGFIALSEAVGRSSKTLMQMLGPKGNPTITNFFEIVSYLQKIEGSSLRVIDAPGRRTVAQHAGKPRREASNAIPSRKQAA